MFQKFKITSCAFIVAFAVLVTLLVNGIAIGQEVDEQAIITSDPERTLKEEIEAIERQKDDVSQPCASHLLVGINERFPYILI